MFTSFDVPEWAIPLSVVSESLAEKYKHMFSSFEVPEWMMNIASQAAPSAAANGAKDGRTERPSPAA
jgi:hypothetical protein